MKKVKDENKEPSEGYEDDELRLKTTKNARGQIEDDQRGEEETEDAEDEAEANRKDAFGDDSDF